MSTKVDPHQDDVDRERGFHWWSSQNSPVPATAMGRLLREKSELQSRLEKAVKVLQHLYSDRTVSRIPYMDGSQTIHMRRVPHDVWSDWLEVIGVLKEER